MNRTKRKTNMMNTKQVNAEIDRQLAARGAFVFDVERGSVYGNCTLRFEVTKHGNPNVGGYIYGVGALETEHGIQNWDYSVNKNFDSREQFVAAIVRRVRAAAKKCFVDMNGGAR
jgi:hypothetical protein